MADEAIQLTAVGGPEPAAPGELSGDALRSEIDRLSAIYEQQEAKRRAEEDAARPFNDVLMELLSVLVSLLGNNHGAYRLLGQLRRANEQ